LAISDCNMVGGPKADADFEFQKQI